MAPVTVALSPKATDAPPVDVGTSFTANATLAFVIANAAKIPATTIFFFTAIVFSEFRYYYVAFFGFAPNYFKDFVHSSCLL